jgi:phage terminase large subunit-like protein
MPKPKRGAKGRATRAEVRDYVGIAKRYARDVTGGKIAAGRYTIAACRRFLEDVERFKGKGARFTLNPVLTDRQGRKYRPADRVCGFVERLRHVKGPFAGERIHLEPWQVWALVNAFGWIVAGSKRRRFRLVYLEVARGNGKSTLTAPLALYMLAFDQESGAEVYSAATTRDQARIIFDDAMQMCAGNPALVEHFDLIVSAKKIALADGSKFTPLSADASTLDGLNLHFGAIDELHAHKTRHVYDVLETALGKRLQPMLWAITTAGINRTGICYEVRSFLTRVLDGVVEDDALFGCIWAADDEDDVFQETAWRKANPNLGVSVQLDMLEQLSKKAKTTPSAEANFRTKHCNQWVSSYSSWLDMMKVRKCARELEEADFVDDPCMIALDLATRVDIAAKIKLFWRFDPEANRWRIFAFPKYFVPMAAIEGGKNDHFAGWVREGLIVATPGEAVDFDTIKADILEDVRRFKRLQEVAFDPWQAHYLAQELAREGLKPEQLIEYRQTVANMSPAMKELGVALYAEAFHYPARDKVFEWMLSNVVAWEDAKENIYPRKESREKKIDGVVAAIMGMGRAMLRISEPPKSSVYTRRGLVTL